MYPANDSTKPLYNTVIIFGELARFAGSPSYATTAGNSSSCGPPRPTRRVWGRRGFRHPARKCMHTRSLCGAVSAIRASLATTQTTFQVTNGATLQQQTVNVITVYNVLPSTSVLPKPTYCPSQRSYWTLIDTRRH